MIDICMNQMCRERELIDGKAVEEGTCRRGADKFDGVSESELTITFISFHFSITLTRADAHFHYHETIQNFCTVFLSFAFCFLKSKNKSKWKNFIILISRCESVFGSALLKF